MSKVTPGQMEGIDLETLFDRHRHICEQLEEKDNLSLEASMSLYIEGRSIELKIKEELDRVERRMVEVIQPDGTIVPFTDKPTR